MEAEAEAEAVEAAKKSTASTSLLQRQFAKIDDIGEKYVDWSNFVFVCTRDVEAVDFYAASTASASASASILQFKY